MTKEIASDGDFITIARVVKTQGRRGEVAAELHTDFPEKFAERKRIFAWMKDGSRRELQLEDHWPHKGQMVLKFAGIDDISGGEELISSELQVPRSERAELETGAYFISELVGCAVFDHGRAIGTLKAIEFGSGEAPNLVIEGKREFLVPFAEAYLSSVDTEAKRLEMNLPEGLLEVDAPLSKKEKRQQQEKEI